MKPAELTNTARLFYPFAMRSLPGNAVQFDYYVKGFGDGYRLADDKNKKDINDRELRIASLLATIEELKGE